MNMTTVPIRPENGSSCWSQWKSGAGGGVFASRGFAAASLIDWS